MSDVSARRKRGSVSQINSWTVLLVIAGSCIICICWYLALQVHCLASPDGKNQWVMSLNPKIVQTVQAAPTTVDHDADHDKLIHVASSNNVPGRVPTSLDTLTATPTPPYEADEKQTPHRLSTAAQPSVLAINHLRSVKRMENQPVDSEFDLNIIPLQLVLGLSSTAGLGVYGHSPEYQRVWKEEGFELADDPELFDVAFTRHTTSASQYHFLEPNFHRKDSGRRIFSHCHSLYGVAGNKCTFSDFTFNLHRALGNLTSTALAMSYTYPQQVSSLKRAMSASGHDGWIAKPCLGRKGHGITVVNTFEDFEHIAIDAKPTRVKHGVEVPIVKWMVQPYVLHPLLVGGRKFHLRLYVVIGSWHPLQVYIHREGLALFASVNYTVPDSTLDLNAMNNRLMFLTNSAVNYGAGADGSPRDVMWSLPQIERAMGTARFRIAWQAVKQAVQQLFCNIDTAEQDPARKPTRTAAAFLSTVAGNQRRCFDFYGLDVIFDENLQPTIMEINKGPSMKIETTSEVHRRTKTALVRDLARTIVRPIAAARDEALGGIPIDPKFDALLDDFTAECVSGGLRRFVEDKRECALTEQVRRAFWALHLQRQRLHSPKSGLDLVYPHPEEVGMYSRQCRNWGAKSPLEELHLQFIDYSESLNI